MVPGLAATRVVTVPVVTLRLVRVRLPLRQPHVTAHGTEAIRDVVLVEWTRPDGSCGWGECPTLSTFGYSDEITDTAWGFLRDVVGPVVADTGAPPHVEGSPMAMAGGVHAGAPSWLALTLSDWNSSPAPCRTRAARYPTT